MHLPILHPAEAMECPKVVHVHDRPPQDICGLFLRNFALLVVLSFD